MARFADFDEFWPYYVSEHLNPTNRRLHFAGTALFFAFSLTRYWAIGIVLAYAFAWTGHFFFEKNKPATFQHPFFSIRGDFRMFGLMLVGAMDRQIKRLSEQRLLPQRR